MADKGGQRQNAWTAVKEHFGWSLPDAQDLVAEPQITLAIRVMVIEIPGQLRAICRGPQQDDEGTHGQLVPLSQQDIIHQHALR